MKIVLILGLLASIGAAALQVMVRSSLKEARSEKDKLNRSIVSKQEEIKTVIARIDDLNTQTVDTNTTAKNEQLATSSLNSEIKALEDKRKQIEADIQAVEQKKLDMNADIERILGGSGGTPEEVLAKVESIKKENEEKLAERETLTKEREVADKAAADSAQLVARLKEQQAARDRTIRLASQTGQVTAVNPEFNFVIVSMGQTQGVTSESKLIVKRGGQFIGRLNIVQIEAGQTVADISQKSLAPGAFIQPGDQVVFETTEG